MTLLFKISVSQEQKLSQKFMGSVSLHKYWEPYYLNRDMRDGQNAPIYIILIFIYN